MRLRTLVLMGIIVFGAFLSCRTLPTQGGTGPVIQNPSTTQQMAALSFLAYLGNKTTGNDDEVEKALGPCVSSALSGQPLTQNWTLVWGPAVYKFALAELDDNMMFVVQNTKNPAHLAIVVRGTNFPAVLDWLGEVLNVHDQVPWEYGSPPSQARIAKGIQDGLQALQTMTPADQPPTYTLSAFLKEWSKTHAPLQIDVTGHSLGGALAPTLALWLADTRANWDPPGKAKITVYAFAGPTAGNAEFAAYYDSRIGPDTHRVWNPKDIVPQAWNVQTLGTVADLYAPKIRANAIERGLFDVLRDRVKDGNYTQIKPQETPLPGAINPQEKSFLSQVAWQHHCGYQCGLGIVVPLPSSEKCPSDTELNCSLCP